MLIKLHLTDVREAFFGQTLIRYIRLSGLLLATFWIFPFFSVRNLFEIACIPPLMAMFWLLLREENFNWRPILLAGLLAGLAVSIRIQSVLLIVGIGSIYLFNKKFQHLIIFGSATMCGLFLTQLQDIFLWGYPFAEIIEYVKYNMAHSGEYVTHPWYLYIIFILGIMIPPLSIYLFAGFFYNYRRTLLLFVPVLLFVAFHSYFPNKQERFILPVLPLLIILGINGWFKLQENSVWLKRNSNWIKGGWRFFWTLNIACLIVVTFSYSKKNRVESMLYLSTKSDLTNFVLESSHNNRYILPPLFYLDKWVSYHYITQKRDLEWFTEKMKTIAVEKKPNYVVFIEEENIDERIEAFIAAFPGTRFEIEIEPSNIDKLLHWLNPLNRNEKTYIYKIGD
ncbi:MAG: hypothetical protein IH946_06795 [Bacteroidetes bacterium]|nr:hypothetical protein [Bacteroidota bacterium]